MSAATNPDPVERPSSPAVTPPPTHPGRRGPWKPLILLALAGLGGWAGYQLWWNKPVAEAKETGPVMEIRTTRVTTGPMEKVARITGQTASQEYYNVTAPIMRGPEAREMILLFMIKSGSKVKKGDLLIQIDGQSSMDHIEDVKDTLESAEADIKKRQAEQSIDLEAMQQSVRVAKSDWDKSKLDVQGSETRTEIDKELLRLAQEEALARYKQVESDVAQKLTAQKSELRILQITRERHVRHLRRHDDDVNKYAIRSQMTGLAVVQTVFRGGDMQPIQQGDQVTPGQLLIKVVDVDQMMVEANVNQSESSEFRIGQEARIRLDAFSGLQLPGKIFSIGAMAIGGWRQTFFVRNVPVKIRIQGADPRLIPDLSAGVDVIMDRVASAKQLPLAAVFQDGDKRVVFVKRGPRFEKREITLGLQSATHAAVTAGLENGDEVALERPKGA